jgi:hypothetical protein
MQWSSVFDSAVLKEHMTVLKGVVPMDDAQKAAAAWATIQERKGGSAKGLEEELATISRFVAERGAGAAIEIFELSQMFKNAAGANLAHGGPTASPKKYPNPIWAIHKDKGGRKVRWTGHQKDGKRQRTTWFGMKLRVEHTTDVSGLVVFKGFIDDEEVAAEKTLQSAKTEVHSTALDRAKMRDA